MRGDVKIPSFFYSMITKQLVRKLAQERIDELDRGLFIVNITISPSFVIHLELDKEKRKILSYMFPLQVWTSL